MTIRIATIGAAALALVATTTVSMATDLLFPGQFMGMSISAPLPVGVFASNLSSYGQSDNTSASVNANIPIITYATPYKFLDSQLLVSYSAPSVYQHGVSFGNYLNGGQDRFDFYSQAIGPTLAHSFGNGFSASLSAFARTPDNYFHNYVGTDVLLGTSYTANGYLIAANFTYSGTFGSHRGTPYGAPAQQLAAVTGAITGSRITGSADAVDVDFTVAKTFDKVQLGFVGFAHTDINTRNDSVGLIITPTGLKTFDKRAGAIAVGGLLGYNFDRGITVQAMVTREIAKRFAYNGVDAFGIPGSGQRETRGWLRVIVPLYVAGATAPAPVVARY